MAQRALDRAIPSDERVWFKVFTAEHMNHEMLHMASDIGRHNDVQLLAPGVLASAGGMARRRVLGTTALASSYLPSQANAHSDIDRACDLLSQVIQLLGSLSIAHSLERVNAARRALAAHAERPSVQEVEDHFRSTIAAVGTPR